MAGGIYVIREDRANRPLVELKAQDYEKEEILQGYLADYSSLLAGEQINPAAPRHWLLVSRELGVPTGEEGGDSFAIDHLFLDQDAIPTLVEVKRSTDTRLRREVVAQMLDYAANGVLYWSAVRLQTAFAEEQQKDEERRRAEGRPSPVRDPMRELLGDADPNDFWQRAETNLRAGKIRLLFVADEIPLELRRIIEFLNAQMRSVDVFAIEVRQYKGEGLTALVPNVVVRKVPPAMEPLAQDEPSFVSQLAQRTMPEDASVGRKILEWAREQGIHLHFGKGTQEASCYLGVSHDGLLYDLIALWASGSVAVQFGTLKERPAFAAEARRLALRDRLNTIPGVELPVDRIGRYPSFGLVVLRSPESLAKLFDSLTWAVREIKEHRRPMSGTGATAEQPLS